MKLIIAVFLFFLSVIMADIWIAANGGRVMFRVWNPADWINVGLMVVFFVASAFVARSFMRARQQAHDEAARR